MHKKMFNELNCFWDNKKNVNAYYIALISSCLKQLKQNVKDIFLKVDFQFYELPSTSGFKTKERLTEVLDSSSKPNVSLASYF